MWCIKILLSNLFLPYAALLRLSRCGRLGWMISNIRREMCKYDSVQIVKYHIIIISLEFSWARVKIENINPDTNLIFYFCFRLCQSERGGGQGQGRGGGGGRGAGVPLLPQPELQPRHPLLDQVIQQQPRQCGHRRDALQHRIHVSTAVQYIWPLIGHLTAAALLLAVFRSDNILVSVTKCYNTRYV